MAAETISIGPDGDQWHYSLATKTYDLARGSEKKLRVQTTRGKEVDAIEISPELSALVIVDMQNYFLHPKCRHHPLGLATVEPTMNIIEKCEDVGIQVVWLNWGLTEHDLATMPAGTRRSPARGMVTKTGISSNYGEDLGSSQGRCLMAGTWNADIYEPLKEYSKPEDVYCDKNRLSGMWSEDQPLRKYLAESGKKTLLFTGVNSDRCVLGTLADAAYCGWDCIAVEDCCATATEEAHEVCVDNIELLHGFVIDSNTFCAATTA
ncbi:hypothetical protein BP6252_09014 [Coleophoma cylindrospora]|uniref:Isochorismatase-like domain-containing protein n=1 Tax=Coleophoma cylindrospora TaxID=1849047 RepID=A0A3D8R0Y8_9HELO|nr:hypothetical protein BP6252_09014 [Coleophoma cylindrospora]